MAQLPTRSLRLRSYTTTDLDRLTGEKGEIFYDYEKRTLKVYNGAGIAASTVTVGPADRLVNGSRSLLLAANGALTISGDIRSEGDINIEINLADSTLQRWRFGEDGSLTFPDGTTQTTAWLGAGQPVYTSLIDSLDSSAITVTPSAVFSSDVTVENDLVAKNIVNGGQIWTFGVNGTLTAPGSLVAPNIFTNLIDSADSSAITVTPAAIFSSDVTVENDLLVKNITLMTGGGGSTIKEGLAPNLAGGAIILTPAFSANDNQALVIYPTAGEGNHIHLTANGGTTELYLGDDNQYVKLVNGGNVEVRSTTSGSTAAWIFDTEGRLTFPAYPFSVIPEHSYGKAGDTAGMVIINDTYIYYCTADYVNNATNIWRRTPHAAGTW